MLVTSVDESLKVEILKSDDYFKYLNMKHYNNDKNTIKTCIKIIIINKTKAISYNRR